MELLVGEAEVVVEEGEADLVTEVDVVAVVDLGVVPVVVVAAALIEEGLVTSKVKRKPFKTEWSP